MAESTQFPSSGEQFNDILLQVNFDSPEKKADKETGLRIAQSIYTSQTGAGSNNLNFFNSRSQRWWSLERWANGTQDMTEFLDYFNIVDGNKAYAKIDLTPIMVGPQFVNTLIESMAKNKEYACVKAVDRASLTEREQDRLDALYRMHFRDEIEEMQKATGMQLEPIRQICINAGVNPEKIIGQISEYGNDIGYNAKTDTIENLIESGIIDPVKALRCSLINAASVAGMVLTSECLIVDGY